MLHAYAAPAERRRATTAATYPGTAARGNDLARVHGSNQATLRRTGGGGGGAAARCSCGKPRGTVGGECAACRAEREDRAYGDAAPAGTGGSTAAAAAPTPEEVINRARLGAFLRCQRAYERLAGIGPPPPPGRTDPAQMWQLQARRLARTIFGEDLNMDQVTEIVGNMRSRLTPGLPVVIAPANDPDCGNRAGYVRGLRPPVVLCPAFFSSSPEEQIRTMVHEAAHIVGIGEPMGESYCGVFDCQTSCGGFYVADSWSHFVHCLSGQTPDEPEVVEAGRP